MDSGVTIAIITGIATVISTVVTVYYGNQKTLYRIDQLEKKVEKHNSVVERTYGLEKEIEDIKNEINNLKKLHMK